MCIGKKEVSRKTVNKMFITVVIADAWLMLLFPQSQLPLSTLVSHSMYNIIANSQPLGHAFFKLFADTVPKTAEKFCALSTEEEGFGYRFLLSQNHSRMYVPGW